MFAITTASIAVLGEVSQLTGSMPMKLRKKLTTPASLFIIQAQTEPETIRGSSHGMRNSARRVALSRKVPRKKTARARPMVYWKISDPITNTAVLRDRKSTRLNSSHVSLSYAVFRLKQKAHH